MSVGVPETLEQALSPQWLTSALSPRFPGLEITSVVRGPVVDRVSTNARFTVDCAGGTLPDGLPAQLCVKGYFNDTGRAMRAIGEPEAYFYRELAAPCGVRTLRSVYADVDPETRHGVVITEDVEAQGGEFLSSGSPYSPDDTAASLTEFATLHAATWNSSDLETAPWLAPRLELILSGRGFAQISQNFAGPIGAGVPEPVRDADRLVKSFTALAAAGPPASNWCVIHGDAHVGNLFRDGAGRPALLDWQLVQRGDPWLDVGYHIASTQSVADRRGNERELVRHYLAELTARGVSAPSWDDAWQGVSAGMVYGYFLWGITLHVDPDVTTELLHRLGTAVLDHDALSP